MKVSRELYQEMQNQTAPKTKSYYTIPMAFLIGGFICTLGELLLHLYAFLGADQTAAAAFTSITLIGCSVLFTGLGWYEKIAKHAGAGTLVPITGFANAVSCCAIESRAEGWILLHRFVLLRTFTLSNCRKNTNLEAFKLLSEFI